MVNDISIEIPFEEWKALEAVVYAARAINEGYDSSITIKEALENLDNLRVLPPDGETNV
jgi:hypothetical protein